MANMRGLTMFISDIRNCTSRDAEEKRVYREMAKIREKFSNTRKNLSGYDKKKYVWKLLYMFMLGYDIDFGHIEAINLICSPRYSEKYTGYMAASLLLSPKSPHLEQVLNAIRNDMVGNDPASQTLALSTVANLGGTVLTDELHGDLMRLVSEHARMNPEILKKALNCLTRFFKEDKRILTANEWGSKLFSILETRAPGLVMSVCNLMLAVVAVHGYQSYTSCYTPLVRTLSRLAVQRDVTQDYNYYQTACPWLQVKILRLLQLFPTPKDPRVLNDLNEALDRITSRTEVTQSINKNNTDHSILFEAIKLIIHFGEEASPSLKSQCVSLLGRFISVKESNIRYIGLETMAVLAQNSPASLERHLSCVLISLRDPDVSIRKRALDVLFGMCYEGNATEIVGELMDILTEADFSIKEDIVLNAALLAEKFGQDLQWYLDVIFNLITYAGDYVSNDIWHRVIQVVTGFGSNVDQSLQEYAATRAYLALSGKHAHENMVKLGAYIISEFSQYLVNQGKDPLMLYETIHKYFAICSTESKCLLLTAYMKLCCNYSTVSDTVLSLFQSLTDHIDPDLQQRAYEYYHLATMAQDMMPGVMEPMPPYKEELQRQNLVLNRMVDMAKQQTEQQYQTEVKPEVEVPAPQQFQTTPASVNLLDL